jgi:putative N6-adenine-specific DNA methylase
MSQANIQSAGLSDTISITRCDFRDVKNPEKEGIIIMNPPYGQRIKSGDTESLYSMIGSTLKHNFEGFTAWLITSDKEALKHVGLKTAMKKILFNGSLECVFVKYDLYKGSKKSY